MEIQILFPNYFIIILSKESVNTEKMHPSTFSDPSWIPLIKQCIYSIFIFKIYAAPRLPFLHAASNSFNFLLASLLRFFGTSI